jgi:tetratricopeptide (TPR) repeat protein
MKANYILESVDNIPALSTAQVAQKNDIKGQALAVRAFCHFDLVRTYGYPYLKDNGQSLGAVIVNKTLAPGEALEMPRSTVADTYNFILTDLQAALPLLFKPSTVAAAQAAPNPANEIAGKIGKLNYWGAKMLQARAYLYMGQYDNAYNAAKEVITDSPYQLITNDGYLASLGVQGGNETIFEILVGSDRDTDMDANNNFDGMYNYVWHANPALARLIPTKAWLDIMAEDPNDIRGKVISVGDGAEGTTWIKKFPGIAGDFKRNNPRIFRLAEAYLIAAEAACRTGKQADADSYLDAIRKRANPNNEKITCTVDAVLKERRKELIGEGHRFFDLMRLGMKVSRTGGFHFAHTDGCPEEFDWSYFKVVLPISSAQRLIYKECTQNPGYPD